MTCNQYDEYEKKVRETHSVVILRFILALNCKLDGQITPNLLINV
jgi:hypothetical protein